MLEGAIYNVNRSARNLCKATRHLVLIHLGYVTVCLPGGKVQPCLTVAGFSGLSSY